MPEVPGFCKIAGRLFNHVSESHPEITPSVEQFDKKDVIDEFALSGVYQNKRPGTEVLDDDVDFLRTAGFLGTT
ncbi:MAG: hypothetical protein FGM57_02340 [Candidatus Taylorbacteria bacterium]|nr:hypothetical protein [Candidatus Taylorbacteria bacterium]